MKNKISLLFFFTAQICMAQVLPTPPHEGQNDGRDITLGMRFKPRQSSQVLGLRYYRGQNFTGTTVGHLWDGTGRKLAEANFPAGSGWVTLTLPSPVTVDSGAEYVCSFTNDGGYYAHFTDYFPKTFDLFVGVQGFYNYARNAYPVETYANSNYSIEPILQKIVAPTAKVDTVLLYVSVDPRGEEDWMHYIDKGVSVIFTMPEIGGVAMLPDSNSLYKAIYGALQPHQLRKDDTTLRLYRFTRNYVINGVSTPVRFTLYKTGAWIREIKDAAGIWQIYQY